MYTSDGSIKWSLKLHSDKFIQLVVRRACERKVKVVWWDSTAGRRRRRVALLPTLLSFLHHELHEHHNIN